MSTSFLSSAMEAPSFFIVLSSSASACLAWSRCASSAGSDPLAWPSATSALLSLRVAMSRSFCFRLRLSSSRRSSAVTLFSWRSSFTWSASTVSCSIPLTSISLRVWSIAFSFWSIPRRPRSRLAAALACSSLSSLIRWPRAVFSCSRSLIFASSRFSVPFSCVSWLFTISACFRNVSGSCSALSFSFFRFSRPALSSATEATLASWLFSAVARSLVAAPSRASSFITSPVRFSMSSRHCAIWGSIAAA